MEELLNQFQEINEKLSDLRNEQENIKKSTYYSNFSSESEREKDLQKAKSRYEKVLKQKFDILDNIQLNCEKEKRKVSSNQRKLKVA